MTRQGVELGQKIQALWLPTSYESELFGPQRLVENFPGLRPFDRLGVALRDNFPRYCGHVVIGAIGLTVRLIAPLIKDKRSDPAVVGLGQDGQYAVSLLSGHLGGANALTEAVALALGGQAVITTATDLKGQPALEVLAQQLNLAIEGWSNLAPLARALAEGEPIPLNDPWGILTKAIKPWPDSFKPFAPETSEPGLWVDYQNPAPERCLIFRPRVLVVGLGGHRGVLTGELEDWLNLVFLDNNLARLSIHSLATIDRRAQEPGFVELAKKLNVPLLSFSPETLATVSPPNPSPIVRVNIGVDSVCEAAALLGAQTGRLLVPKRKSTRVTCAVALKSLNSLDSDLVTPRG
ncbi:MAG: cobalamin biosynthesis protein [Deltaproteobacteria bacterium]|nr:cobalamin biosynthesis protein [Deltaproteobacteria bacterium]